LPHGLDVTANLPRDGRVGLSLLGQQCDARAHYIPVRGLAAAAPTLQLFAHRRGKLNSGRLRARHAQ
jgi:hypothetical protein